AKKSSAATAYELSKAREAAIEQFGKDGKAIPLDDQIKALKAAAPGRLIIVQFKGYAVAQADDGVAIAKATGKKMNEKGVVPPWVEIVDAELASVVATLHKLGHKLAICKPGKKGAGKEPSKFEVRDVVNPGPAPKPSANGTPPPVRTIPPPATSG